MCNMVQFPHESDADYIERLAKDGRTLPPGIYYLDRPLRLERHAIVGASSCGDERG